MVKNIPHDSTQASHEAKSMGRCVPVVEWQEYPESVVKILLAQPLNPLVKLDFKVTERTRE